MAYTQESPAHHTATQGELTFGDVFLASNGQPSAPQSSPYGNNDPQSNLLDTPVPKRSNSHGQSDDRDYLVPSMGYMQGTYEPALLGSRPPSRIHSRAPSANANNHSRASSNKSTLNHIRAPSIQPATLAPSSIHSMHGTPNPDYLSQMTGTPVHIMSADGDNHDEAMFAGFLGEEYGVGEYEELGSMDLTSGYKASSVNTPTGRNLLGTPSSFRMSDPSSISRSYPYHPPASTTRSGAHKSTKYSRETPRVNASPHDSPSKHSRQRSANARLMTTVPLSRTTSAQLHRATSGPAVPQVDRNLSGSSMPPSSSLGSLHTGPSPFPYFLPSTSLPNISLAGQDPSPNPSNNMSNLETPQENGNQFFMTSPFQTYGPMQSLPSTSMIDQTEMFSQAGSVPGSTTVQPASSFPVAHRQSTLGAVDETPELLERETMGFDHYPSIQYPQHPQHLHLRPQIPRHLSENAIYPFSHFQPDATHYPQVNHDPVAQWQHTQYRHNMMNPQVGNMTFAPQPRNYGPPEPYTVTGQRSASMGTSTGYIPHGGPHFNVAVRAGLRTTSDSQLKLGASGSRLDGGMSGVRVLPPGMQNGGLFPADPAAGMQTQNEVEVPWGGMRSVGDNGVVMGSNDTAMSRMASSEGMGTVPPIPPYNIGHHQPQRRQTKGSLTSSSPSGPSRRAQPTVGKRSKPGPKPKNKGVVPKKGTRTASSTISPQEAGPSFNLPIHGDLGVQIGQGGSTTSIATSMLFPSSGSGERKGLDTLEEDDESVLSDSPRDPLTRSDRKFGPPLDDIKLQEWQLDDTHSRPPSAPPQHALQLRAPTHAQFPNQLHPHPYHITLHPGTTQPVFSLQAPRSGNNSTNPDGTSSAGLPRHFIEGFYHSILSASGRPDGIPIKQFQCNISGCLRIVPWKSAITSHIQTHLEDKPFVCEFKDCESAFVRSHDLRRHQKTHLGHKPYMCACEKGFARGDALMRHRQRGICSGAIKNDE